MGEFGREIWACLGGVWRFWWEFGDIFWNVGEFSRDFGVTPGEQWVTGNFEGVFRGWILGVVLGAPGVDSSGDFGGGIQQSQ